MNLEQEFQKEMIQKMAQAKIECKYNPTRFNQMIARYGGVETAKRLIDGCIRTGTPSEGYTTLLMAGRTDLTLEDSVCNPKYRESLILQTVVKNLKNYLSTPYHTILIHTTERREKASCGMERIRIV